MSTTTNEPIAQNEKNPSPQELLFHISRRVPQDCQRRGTHKRACNASKAWNALSQEEREPWKIKKQHREEYPGWKFAPLKREDTGGARKGTKKREKTVQELALRKATENAVAKGAAKADKAAKGRQKGGKAAQNIRPATKEDPVTHTNGSVVISRAEASDLSIGLSYAKDVRYTNSALPVPVWDTPHSKRVVHGRHFIVNVVDVDDNDVFIRSISHAVTRVLTEKVALNPRLGMEEESENQHALRKGITVNSERSRSENVEPSPRSLDPRSGMMGQLIRSKVTKSKETGSRNVEPSPPPAS